MDATLQSRCIEAGWLDESSQTSGVLAWTEDGAGAMEALWNMMEELGGQGKGVDEQTWLALRKVVIERYG